MDSAARPFAGIDVVEFGQFIAVPFCAQLLAEVGAALMMAALVAQNNSMVRVESVDGPIHASGRARLRELRAAGRSFEEQAAVVTSARTPAMLEVYYRTYATKDDVVGIACV